MIPTCKKIYLCDFNLHPLMVLNGVDTNSVEYSCHVKDYDELTFDVDEYIIIDGKKVKSLGYDLLLPYMTVYLEDLGMFQMQNPKTSNDGNSEKKSITAYSLEKEFEDKNWLNFKCNTGEKDSLEQVAENNLNELGYAKEFVTFYNKNKHDLSFIHLLLEKLPGWSVDDDDIDPVLWTRKLPAITQDNTNLYALCCSYIAPRMEILFLFDTIHRKIKAIAKENLNDKKYESTVFISYRNLAQSIDIDVDEDSIFTRFNVRGDDDLNVINCNYGDYYVMNLDYFLCSPYMPNSLITKVKKWLEYRDANRDKYIEIAKNAADASQKVNDIIYRNPADDLDIKQWDDMNEDGLNESLKYYNSLLTSLQVSVDPNWDASNNDFSTYKPWTKADGSVDHDKYLEKLKAQENGYGGYYTYYDILHYIIPNIEIAIRNLKKVDEKKEDYVKDWETNWDLYGTSELDALNKKYTEELEKVQDYAKPWSELTDEEKRANSGNKDSYNIYHNKYVEIYGYISANGTLTAAIAKRNQEKKEAQKILDGYNSQMSSMKISASINNADYGFTDEDKTVIYSLFHDQDYQNNNIVSTSVDTSVTEIDREKELYDDAVEKLSEVAQPQFKFTVSLDNLYRIEAFKHWQGELELLKFIRLGIRDDYSVKLRVTGITWNPCDVTEDLTLEFSNMITSRSGRTDLTELLDTENNRGSKNSISFGTGDSDSEKEYLSSMLQQLVKMGAFKTAVGNIAGSTTANLDEARINTLVSNFINASKIKVDNIEGDKGSFNEFFTKYLDSEVISTNLINGQNGDFIDFVNSHLNMKHITTELLQGETGNTFIDFVHNEMKTGTITADQIRSEDGKTFVDLVNGQIQAAKITTDQISGGDGTTFIDFLKNQISTFDITANQIKGWGDSQTLIDFVNNKITTSNISANKITGLNDSKTFIDFVNNQINTSVINSDLENVKNILAGNAGVGNLQSIHLTSANAVIDEAVIKQIIAAKISVADLMIHEATAELITLISQDGKPSIAFKNSTQQFYDSNGNVRVQIGQDATGAFTFSLFDETGKGVLIDSETGVHAGAIADGLIVNDMIQSGTVSKDKLSFPIVETDENGKISITNILDGKGNEFGVSYTEYQESVATELSSINSNLSGVSSTVSKIDKSITDKIWESDITTKINDYDQTTVKDIRDRTTSVEKNITGINSTVKDMQTTLESKADGTTVQSLTIRVSKAEQDMSGFKQTVESTYSTKSETESVNNYAKTSFEQLSDKFSWLVDGTSSSTSLTLTDSLVSAITNQFVIKSPDGTSTIIEGGKIKTGAITTDMLSSSVIKSKNYKEGTYVDGAGYSILGTFLDLDNGMIHTPGFYTDTIGNAYFNGTINALDGWFGTEQHNWYIGTTIITDIMNNDGALTGDEYSYLKATENAAIVVNEWHLQSQNDNMSLQSGLTTLNNGKFVLNPQDNKYYDFGIVKPDMSKDAKSYNKKFLYIRRADTPTTHPQDWEYLFHVDYDGSIWYKNQNVAGGNVFLSTTGGTIKGDLTVTGTLNATANQAKKVVNALSINGKAYDGSAAINVGSISIAYGGTGGTTVSEARANLGVLGANNKNGYYGLARPDGNDTDWIRSTVNGLIPYQSGIAGDGHSSLGTSTWYFSEAYIDFIHGSLKGTADRAICDDEGNKISSTYLKATSTEFDSITVGNMIVNGTARFVNGLMGTLTGNVIGNVSGSASYATSSDTANYINLVATNEIRFYKNQFKGGTVHFGYRWSDGSTSPLITEYRFNNGNGSPTQVTASQFNGNLNGIATRTTLLNPVTTSDTFTTGTSIWRNDITDGYVVWGQWWKDTNLTNDTGDLTIWIRKVGSVTTANMTIDGTIYAVGGFNGNATSATKLQTARKIGNASFDGTADISLSSIGAASSGHIHNYASTLSLNGTDFTVASNKITVNREQLLTAIGEVTKTANGYMSAADKAKLDNINVSDIGTVGANSIKGTGYINVSILKGVATISHGISGVTAGTYGADSTNNFTIPKIVVDSTGHITSASAYSVTAANIVSKLGTTAVNRATADSDGNAINTTYLKLSGGTMTGNISYKGTKATYDMITFIDNPNDTYGNGIAIGGGGTVIIGGGESSDFCKNNYISDGGNERLILANDGMIDFYVNCQEGSTSKAVHTYIDTTGKYIGVSQKATQLETSRNIFGKSFNGTSDVAGQAMVYGWYNSNAETRYVSGGLQIRENNCVQNKQSDIAYAPSIGFHWSNRIAATLLFHSDGIFYFRKQNFTDRATIDANLNAGSIATTTANIYGTATFTNMSVHNGGIKSGLLHLQGTTSASIAYGANNPKIKFVNSDGSQIVELMYTDYDSVRWPAGLAVRGNQGNEYFDVPHLYATQVHVDNHCALQYDSSNQCLNFVFS